MKTGSFLGRFKFAIYLAVFAGLFGGTLVYAQTTNAYNIAQQLCSIVALVSQIIGILALFMFIVGGVLYAFAHFLPASGNIKGSMQGWGMGIVMGGIIMLILYLLAPFIVTKIISVSQNGVIPGIANIGCNSVGQPTGNVGGIITGVT